MLILVATAAMLLVGCSKDNEANNFGIFSYSVSIEDWTHPVLDGVSVSTTIDFFMQ